LVNDAEFTVLEVERQVDDAQVLKKVGDDLPESILRILADDEDAFTSHFVLIANAEHVCDSSVVHKRLRNIADQQRALSREVQRLDAGLAEINIRVRHWSAETDALALQDRANQPSPSSTAALERLEKRLDGLAEHLAADGAKEAARDEALRQARESLLGQVGQLKTLIARCERVRYRRTVLRVREAVAATIPSTAIVAVVSRGDDELITLGQHRGWHFPQTKTGVYAGHHPADSKTAIAHLRMLCSRGARYLVFPQTALWWLDHYREFNAHLLQDHRCVFRDERTCVIYALKGPRSK
jgi:hypothetical protein